MLLPEIVVEAFLELFTTSGEVCRRAGSPQWTPSPPLCLLSAPLPLGDGCLPHVLQWGRGHRPGGNTLQGGLPTRGKVSEQTIIFRPFLR